MLETVVAYAHQSWTESEKWKEPLQHLLYQHIAWTDGTDSGLMGACVEEVHMLILESCAFEKSDWTYYFADLGEWDNYISNALLFAVVADV